MPTQEEQFKDAQRQEGEQIARRAARRDFGVGGETPFFSTVGPNVTFVAASPETVRNWNQPAQLAKTRAQFAPHFALMDKQAEERELLDAEEGCKGGESL